MKTFIMPDAARTAQLNTNELRENYLVEGLFAADRVVLSYADVDRTVIGSAVPAGGALTLGTDDSLRSAYFTERRELGILNIGGPGVVTADGKRYDMDNLDCLYIGRGVKDISFTSIDGGSPAKFYLLSYPAHATYPTVLAKKSQAEAVHLGSQATSNQRTIYKYIHPAGIKSCQLVMGFTQLAAGNVWNSMPPHTHMRRSEVYLYFNLAANSRIFHFMGRPQETRHLLIAEGQAVISPSWSIHCGVGTGSYTFCWAMGGENQVFDDMDGVAVTELR